MVGIAEEPPRQLAPFVGIATTGFRYPGGIRRVHHHQQIRKIGSDRLARFTFFGFLTHGRGLLCSRHG
jgi:hypothetical protein